MSKSGIAAFLHKDEYTFQRISQEAYNHEPGISVASVYGLRGESQHGVDVTAIRTDGKGIEVAQCKRYAKFTVANVRTATKEFFKEWKRWRPQTVRRFVLIVACDISKKTLQDEVAAQRRKFKKRGLKYDAWGCYELASKLNPHRSAVQNLYGPAGADEICGPVAETEQMRAQQRFIGNHLGAILIEFEKDRGGKLESLREKSRAGKNAEALAEVLPLKSAASWAGFSSELKARFLRFEAAVRLNLNEPVALPRQLVEDAKRADANADYQVIDAYLAYRENGANAGLALLAQPKTLDAWNTRWSMMLEVGRASEVVAEFAALDKKFEATAETHRLLALGHLLSGNLSDAQTAVARAVSLCPHYRSVRVASAIVDFRSCLVEAADAGPSLTWPTPVPWAFIRRDAESLTRLRRAAPQFAAMVAAETGPTLERTLFETWHLACLACDPALSTEAESLAQTLLATNPAHFRVAAWAVERDYVFNREAVAIALAAELTKQPRPDLDMFLAHCAVLLSAGKFKAAEKALDEAEAAFKDSGNHDVWRVQKMQFLARNGRRTDRLLAAVENEKMREQATLATLKVGRGTKQNYRRVGRALAKEYERTCTASVLFKACDALFRANDWSFIAGYAATLVEKVPTDAALRLALHGLFYHGDYQECLDLLRDKQHLLQGGPVSPEIRVLQAACQEKIGQWQAAVREAESLYREKPNLRKFADYFRILFQTGDTRRAAIVARDLLTMHGVTVPMLLRAAHVTRLHDQDLAKELWRKAAKLPLGDLKILTGVVGLAFELGVEREAADLQQRLFARARGKQGIVQWKSLEDIIEMSRQHREEQERLSRSYDRSEAPIHLIAPQVGAPLVHFYHALLEGNRKIQNLTAVPALLARYGGRTMPEAYAPETLYADLTGIILAADLGILDLVETQLGPVYLAPEATGSLVEQVGRCTPHQPSLHAWRADFLRLVAAETMGVIEPSATKPVNLDDALKPLGADRCAAWQSAHETNARLVAEWPLTRADLTQQPINLSPLLAPDVFNLRELLRAATIAGGLTPEEFTAVIGPPNVFQNYPERAGAALQWRQGEAVLLTDVALRVLALEGLLPKLAGVFKLSVMRSAFTAVKKEEEAHNHQVALAAWTQALLERIRQGITLDRYRILPQTLSTHKKAEKMGIDGQGLGNLLRAIATSKTAALWSDDRTVNRYPLAGSRPIVSIVEILRMLQSKGALTAEAVFDKLDHLRRSNVRYLSVSSEEILHHLQRAPVAEQELVETPALAALRRYVAACVLDRQRLQGPVAGGPARDIKEWDFVLQMRHAIDEAFRDVWADETETVATREARANWLWRSLYVDVVGVRQILVNEFKPGEERELTAFLVGSLFSLGIGVPAFAKTPGTKSAREVYFDWLGRHLLKPLEHASAGFTELAARVVAKDVERTCRAAQKVADRKQQRAQIFLTTHLMMHLPHDLLQKISLPADVLSVMGVKVHGPSGDIEGHTYDLVALTQAQADAINGRPNSVSDQTGKQTLHLERDPEFTGVGLKMRVDSSLTAKRWREVAFPVLLADVSARIDYLEKNPAWFACDEVTRRAAIQNICNLERPLDRVLQLNGWIDDSPEVGYQRLEAKLQGEHGVALDQFHPASWSRMLQQLRLGENSNGTAAQDLDAAAALLLKEEGLPYALRRWMTLPRLLPAVLEDAWRQLPPTEATDLWSRLPRYPRSVVADLHLIRLAHLREDLDRTLVQELLGNLLDPTTGPALFESFHAILEWVNRDLSRWPDRRQYAAWKRLLLVWYHASRLHGLLRAGHADLPKLQEWLRQHTSSWHHGVLDYDRDYAEDVSHPHIAGTGCLFVNGLANLLADVPAEVVAKLDIPGRWKQLEAKSLEYCVHVKLDFYRRNDLLGNSIGSFLATSTDELRGRLLGTDWRSEMPWADSDAGLLGLIEAAGENPQSADVWSPLVGMLRELPTPPACRAAMAALLSRVQFSELAAQKAELAGVALNFASNQARSLQDAGLTAHMEDQMLRLVTGEARARMPKDERQHFDLVLLQALLALAIVPGDEAATAKNYFEKISRLVERQPELAKLLLRPVRYWLTALPFEQQPGLHSLLYTVRALA